MAYYAVEVLEDYFLLVSILDFALQYNISNEIF
jgi:hypothetical protein